MIYQLLVFEMVVNDSHSYGNFLWWSNPDQALIQIDINDIQMLTIASQVIQLKFGDLTTGR